MYMIRRERGESSVAHIFLKWEGKNREEKANMVAESELIGGQPAESVQSVTWVNKVANKHVHFGGIKMTKKKRGKENQTHIQRIKSSDRDILQSLPYLKPS